LSAAVPRIAVLISGEGTNLQALMDAEQAGTLGAHIGVVVSNRSTARGLDRARGAAIPAEHLPAARGMSRAAYDNALAELLARYAPSLIVLAGFMRILTPEFVALFRGRMLNVHPALLPLHRGLDTHRRVLEAGDRWHGATVHFVTSELDAGPRIIQYRLPVRTEDSVESLAQRVHVGEHIILPRAVAWLSAGRLSLADRQVILDGHVLLEPVVVEEDR
jgi:phosphoribosylglycinamide formyltransferase 1